MTVEYSSRSKFGLTDAVKDIILGLRAGRIWRAFAWEEVKRRYRRSVFGLAWIAISYAIFIAAIAVFFGGFSVKASEDFTLYVAAGLAAFTFLSSSVQDGSVVFISSASWINSVPLPYSVYAFKSVARSLIPFGIQVVIFIALALAFGRHFTPIAFLSLPALVIYLVNAFAFNLVFGYLTARFRDLEHLISSLIRVLFFVTPILWVYDDLSSFRLVVANLNPFTHLIEIFRAPLLGEFPSRINWIYSAAFTGASSVSAILVSAGLRRRLPLLV